MTPEFLWLAASSGLLSVLTPCVFPMVPVTVAYFSSPADRGSALRRAILFGAGIVATFTILGLALAAVFGAAGLNRLASNPIVNLVLAGMFLLFAANLFDWLQLRLPSRLLTAADRSTRQAQRGDSFGALIMGAVFTLTSVTCTAPFVGTLLVLAARGSWQMPIVGMLVYSVAFALPFVLLAMAPRLLAGLPRAGEWIRTLRVMIGLLEIGAAVKFISNVDLVLGWGVFTRSIVLAVWTALALVAAGYLGLGLRHKILRRELRPVSFAPAAVALLVAAWLGSGIGGRPLRQIEAFLPPPVAPAISATTAGTRQSWILNDYDGALQTARSAGKLVFIDFTGYTCTNCRWMEANIFSRHDVGAELGRFVLARLYTDGEGEMYERQQNFQERTFGTVALPLYAVVDARGAVRATLSGLTRDPAEFIAFLRQADTPRVAEATLR
ncbi:MAG TPA: cytochrome c biogenesis protein CcdA [Gemmatimonadaceae bacterium]|nr:cytochrome c biogenesis protein CcdA [Gemmatimonadaceae bacterium]